MFCMTSTRYAIAFLHLADFLASVDIKDAYLHILMFIAQYYTVLLWTLNTVKIVPQGSALRSCFALHLGHCHCGLPGQYASEKTVGPNSDQQCDAGSLDLKIICLDPFRNQHWN